MEKKNERKEIKTIKRQAIITNKDKRGKVLFLPIIISMANSKFMEKIFFN